MAVPAVGFPFTAGYIADGLGLWEKHGLRVKTIVIAGIGSTNAVISGSAEFAQMSGLSLNRAAANGQQLLVIVNTLDKPITEISIRKDIADAGGFDPKRRCEKRAQILKGHTFAVGGINTVVHAYLRIVARFGGLDPESIRVTPMAGDKMLAAMQTKAIDGISTVLPWPRKGRCWRAPRCWSRAAPKAIRRICRRSPSTCWRPSPTPARSANRSARRSAGLQRGHGLSSATTPKGTLTILKKTFAKFDDAVLTASIDVVRRSTPVSPAATAAQMENADNFNVEAG